MNQKLTFSLIVAFFLLPGLLWGQGDTLEIGNDFRQLQANSHFNYFNTEENMTAGDAWRVLKGHDERVKKVDRVNFGPVNGYYWLTLTLKNTSRKSQDLYLQIRQPHIYRMIFYQVRDDSIVSLSETGIHYNFYQRPSPHRYFDFPIHCDGGESFTILLMVHQINSLTLPIYLSTEEEVQENIYNQNLIWGYWFGFLSFCALFAFIASIILRKSVFLWYFLYIFSAALYGFTEQGYGFQFFFPGWADVEAPVIVQLGAYVFIFLIKFSQGLLDTRKHLFTVHRILNGLFYFVLALILAAYVMPGIMFTYSTIVLPVVNVVMLSGLALLAFSGIKTFFTNRIIAVFYLIAYTTLVAASTYSILNYGFGVMQYVGPNPVLIAYFFEAMLLSVALVILFRQIQMERTRLVVELADQQKNMYQQYIDGIEKERSRIAGELHDDVGSRLSHLKRLLQTHSEESLRTAEQVEQLIKDVRQLSHDLSPPLALVTGLEPLLEKLIADTRRASGLDIKFQVYNLKEGLTPAQIQQAYRIVQEALNNIIKHAEATRVDVQLFEHPTEIDIIIEDNGKGFDVTNTKDRFGLDQMRIRTESLGGRIEINSHPGKGTHILVQIPVKK